MVHTGDVGILAFLLILATPSCLFSQDQIRERTCDRCELRLERRAVIPTAADGIQLVSASAIAAKGSTFLLAPTFDDKIAVWDGSSLRALGRGGGGPGEFPDRIVAWAVTSDGAFHTVHGSRLSQFAGDPLRLAHQVTLPLRAGGMTSVGQLLAIPRNDGSVTLMGTTGAIVRRVRTTLKTGALDALQLAASGDTAFWVASTSRYRIDLVRLDGTVLRSLQRMPDWFKGAGYRAGEPVAAPPAPRIYMLREIGPGLLAVLINVADRNWKPSAERDLRRLQYESIYDSIVEVIDVANDVVLWTGRFDRALRFTTGDTLLWTTHELPDGDLEFHIFAPVMVR